MNENHAHDKDLLEKVERLLHRGQTSGDDLLDSLAATQPQARADFQQTLEDQLVATLQAQQRALTQEENMTTHSALAAPKRHRNFRLPVTLAAALAVMLAAISLFASIRPPAQVGFVAQASTDTPFPTPTLVPTATADALALTATAMVAGASQTVPAPAGGITHVVQPGDTLAALALLYGVEVEALLAANNLAPGAVVEAGQTLVIPLVQGRVGACIGGIRGELYAEPSLDTYKLPLVNDIIVQIIEVRVSGWTWYLVRGQVYQAVIQGWVRADRVSTEFIQCPSSVMVDEVASPGFQPVLIARDTIRRGTQITAEMLATAYLPVDIDLQRLFGSSRGVASVFDGSPEQAAGQYALVDIPALMPLLVNDLVAENPTGRLPRNMSYPARIPLDREAADQFASGDLLAVFAELAYLDQEQQPHTITRPIVDVAEVLEVTDAEASDQVEVVITMASNNDRLLIMELVDAGVPLTLVQRDGAAADTASRIPASPGDIPADLQPVVVARFPLQKGTWLTEDALMLVYVPQDSVPAIARSDMNGLIGQYLQRDFERWQPILAGDVASRAARQQVEEITLPGAGWQMSLNGESRARVFIPLDDMPDQLSVGERVAITTQIQFREDDESGLLFAVAPDNQMGRSVTYRILVQPELVEVAADGLVLSMYATEAADVTQALEAGLPLKLGYAAASAASAVLPEGTVEVSIPLDSTTASTIREGDIVDVQADMLFVDLDEQFQAGDVILADQIAAGQTPEVVTQVIVKGVQVIEIGADTVMLAASPQDALVLQWASEAKLPLTFTLTSERAALTPTPTPTPANG